MTPLEAIREAAAVPADRVTVESSDLRAAVEEIDRLDAALYWLKLKIREFCEREAGHDDD